MAGLTCFGGHARWGWDFLWKGFSISLSKLMYQYFLFNPFLWFVKVFCLLVILFLVSILLVLQNPIHIRVIIIIIFYSIVLVYSFWAKLYFSHSSSVHIKVLLGTFYTNLFPFFPVSFSFIHKLLPITLWPCFLSIFQISRLDSQLFS